jgi:outer membrane protein assembly factor BamB
MKTGLPALALGVIVATGSVRADDWPAFRGPTGDGISTEKSAPTTWSKDKNIKWRVPLPQPGNSSPIVANGRVFLTCASDADGKQRTLFCFDRRDGKQLWAKTVEFGKQEETFDNDHDNAYCAGTPVSDGKVVVVWHSSAGLYCYDFEGKEIWKRDLGLFEHIWGYGTSPVLLDGKVILNSGPGKRVFVTAINLTDGKTLWEVEEPQKGESTEKNENGKYKGSWTSPFIIKVDGKPQILCSMPTRLVAYAPEDGKILWWCEGIRFANGDVTYSSPVLAGDCVLAFAGYTGPTMGIKLGGAGDVTAANRLWRTKSSPQSIGSGVAIDGFVYHPYESMIACIKPATGEFAWRDRAKTGGLWGSIVFAAGRLYVTDRKGTTFVFKPNPEKFDLTATNELGEKSNSTPAVSNGEIFIRTFKALYCIAE